MPTLTDVVAGSLSQAAQVQQIVDALKGTPSKGVPVAMTALNDLSNYALTVQNDDPTNSRALSVLKSDGSTLLACDATGVTLGAPLHFPTGALGMSGDLTVSGNLTSLGGTLTVGATSGNQGNLLLIHPNGHISRIRGGASGHEFTNAANSAVNLSIDDSGNLTAGGNLALNSAVNTAINFGDVQMIAPGATYIQTNGYLALGVGSNGYRLVLPNIANGNGQGEANAWITYSCIDHARQYSLDVSAVADPLGKVQAIQGYYYDHISFDENGEPIVDTTTGSVESNPTYGFAASEVEAVLPELVADDGTGVDLPRMVVILWEAVRELAARVPAPA